MTTETTERQKAMPQFTLRMHASDRELVRSVLRDDESEGSFTRAAIDAEIVRRIIESDFFDG